LLKKQVITIVPCTNLHNIKKAQIELGEQSANMSSLCMQIHKAFGGMLFWTYAYIVSSLENSDDITYLQNRIAKIPKDLTDLLRPFYPLEEVGRLENLLREHFLIVSRLIGALKRNSPVEYDRYNKDLYENADYIIDALFELNPNYDKEELKRIFYSYLDAVKRVFINRRNQTFVQEIQNVDIARNFILELANYIAVGLREQFPDRL
jgi:hypothetical protein